MSSDASREAEPRPIEIDDGAIAELRERLARTRWPEQGAEGGWELGTDLSYARELCDHWRERYETKRLERLNELGSFGWEDLHFLRLEPDGPPRGSPVVLLHGWPSGPIEYEPAARRLAEGGREVVVPSLPGFAWSADPGEALDVTGMAARIRALLSEGLGLERCAIAGGDWGGTVAARIAFDAPELVVGLYGSTPGVLPRPGDLARPPMSEAEIAYVERAQRWLRRGGHHMVIQAAAPDVISPALTDSPAGLAAYLVEKYRRWSDCGGDVERRFSKDDLCDFLTMFWTTGSISSSMRLYWGEGRNRWRLAPNERIETPAAVGAFPPGMRSGQGEGAMLGNPPREWTERVLADLRRWTPMPSGGHFAAFEEPELYVSDLVGFLDELGAGQVS
ncbi:MAG: epoxide hydrolase family protein [Solirubrobacterales bacterium]